jgi:hypothetical protein
VNNFDKPLYCIWNAAKNFNNGQLTNKTCAENLDEKIGKLEPKECNEKVTQNFAIIRRCRFILSITCYRYSQKRTEGI